MAKGDRFAWVIVDGCCWFGKLTTKKELPKNYRKDALYQDPETTWMKSKITIVPVKRGKGK